MSARLVTVGFVLSMPGRSSWNGKWSGDDRFYGIARRVPAAQAESILAHGSYYHHFGDGWVAAVTPERLDAPKARALRKRSNGFCGYDWMVSSIIQHGEIRTS